MSEKTVEPAALLVSLSVQVPFDEDVERDELLDAATIRVQKFLDDMQRMGVVANATITTTGADAA